MTLGIGLYAPCMILVYLLGMAPTAAFPIMMGSCAFLMPFSSVRFVRSRTYHPRASLSLALGGFPAAIIAAKLVTWLPPGAVRWLVIVVGVYTGINMLATAGGLPGGEGRDGLEGQEGREGQDLDRRRAA